MRELTFAHRIADRIIFMKSGRIAEDGRSEKTG